MSTKKNVRNLSVYHSESKRDTKGNLVLTLIGRSPKERPKKKWTEPQRVNATIEFEILPYIIREMKKAWSEERARRIAAIQAVDSINFAPDAK